jgi:predicted NBD/HSP70 family sugar kinase
VTQPSETITPACRAALDEGFRPAVLELRAMRSALSRAGVSRRVGIALEQSDGLVNHFFADIFPENHPEAARNFRHIERMMKFLLWSRGGHTFHLDAPETLVRQLAEYYSASATGKFDSQTVGERMFDRPIAVVHVRELPPQSHRTRAIGRHLEGCRIGFDLGGSDRKVAAVMGGRVVFSEEKVWDPYFQSDPQYHFDGVMDSLRAAAAHLPRVDAIGGSAAGVYVQNRVKVASLFRGVPREAFERRVKNMFLEVQRAWDGVPMDVVNDGEVTALAASMSLGVDSVLGISLGTSTAAGYVNEEGNITSWINELAFVPVDYRMDAPVDEWSGDRGCGVQYFSQQAVSRLMPAAGIESPPDMPFAEKLKVVQKLMAAGDERAGNIYQTIGTYLGYFIAHCADFYDLRHVLILGRVTSGEGGNVILSRASEVLQTEFPALASQIAFHIPDEKEKRHGQAIAAASLPELCSANGISATAAILREHVLLAVK